MTRALIHSVSHSANTECLQGWTTRRKIESLSTSPALGNSGLEHSHTLSTFYHISASTGQYQE